MYDDGMLMIMIVGCDIMGIGAESLPVLIAGCILRGVGNAGISACMFAMVTDTIEYGEWKGRNPYRRSDQ